MVGYPTRLVEIIGSQLCGPPQDAFSLSLVTSDPIACDAPLVDIRPQTGSDGSCRSLYGYYMDYPYLA